MNLILTAHGTLASSFKLAAAMIAGSEFASQISAVDFDQNESSEDLKSALSQVMAPEENLVLCDIKGGSPFNAAYLLRRQFPIQIITGMNLAMILELLLSDTTGEARLTAALEAARQSPVLYR